MRVAVGVSGGVDSSVAALLLKEQGHEVIGVTMALGRAEDGKTVAEARAVADRLGIPLHVFDFAEAWNADVLRYVRDAYLGGRTPNPCVRCNETVKFWRLPHAAFALGCDRFATGHYARIVGGRLFRAVDRTKDQSYFLYRVKPEILARTIFPLGEMTKTAVRETARRFGLATADRGDSQDFCGGDPMVIVGAAPREGNIVRTDGKVLGRHQGFWNYTVGKRKGLGIGGGTPYYVVGLDAAHNEVVVGFREEAVRRDLEVRDPVGLIDKSLPVKVRSAGEPRLLRDGIAGIAPGQSAVFYRGDEVAGGGIIV
ncbi:MAG: tRNA 2-thiouridine(34) synthase MnmA [Kiritimatiellia bacterium]